MLEGVNVDIRDVCGICDLALGGGWRKGRVELTGLSPASCSSPHFRPCLGREWGVVAVSSGGMDYVREVAAIDEDSCLTGPERERTLRDCSVNV